MDHDAPVYLHQLPVPGEERYLSLALVNTRFALSHGTVDLLDGVEAAHLWLVRHQLLPDHVELNGWQSGRLRALREALRALFEAYGDGRVPSAESLAALNSALAAAPSTPRLLWPADGPRRADEPDTGNPAAAALSLLAEDATDLLTGPEAEQLTACAAQGCTRWFLRSHGARRWCTTRCGNRVRAARAYAAKREPAVSRRPDD
ncbi:CGNR zinc finger domain-containing protein [Streptomyces sp. 3213]|uniref:CGNR zinc finger domain-containing protein n=1 Tax=Streptomyces sp. 3213.3 TaxID=1855348 RepID=UPI00089C51F3|nr:ABATE domain-containing protein [Streptomyces sp. 3213.3]SED03298.1 CGNR zinc finger domain-containing protein [Streptomyces sp. 3213] [Streptomyces sp. 3213.3]